MRSCEVLSTALSSQTSRLKFLDLSNNDLLDSGVKLLSVGLGSQHCVLEILSLSGCLIAEEGCMYLASALSSNPSHLRVLNLSFNHPAGSGVALLSAGLENPNWKLSTLRLDHGGPHRLKPGITKYVTELELDTNTMSRNLKLSDNNWTLTHVEEEQPYPDHQERCEAPRVLCKHALTDRCHFEFEWTGCVTIALTYRRQRTDLEESEFGENDHSWSLQCEHSLDEDVYCVQHNHLGLYLNHLPSLSRRVAVNLDYLAGTLSFHTVSSNRQTHIYTFKTKFTEPLYVGFALKPGSSVFLCSLKV